MATTTDAAPVAPVEEGNAAPAAAEEEPPKKVEAAVATTDAAPVAPASVEDENPALAAAAEEELTEKFESAAAAAAEEEVDDREAPKQVVADVGEREEEEEEVRLEAKSEGVAGPEAENGKAEGVVVGGHDGRDVNEAEEDRRVGKLGAATAVKDGGGEEPASEDGEAAASVSAPVSEVESKSENGESGEGDPSLASPDAPESDEKGELQEEEQHDEERGAAVEVNVVDKIAEDVESPVAEEEKLVPEVEKGEEVGSGSAVGGELSDEEEVEVSPSPLGEEVAEVAEPQDKIMKELAEGSSSGSISRDFTNSMDGQIMLDDSEDDDDDNDDDGDEKGFDSAALAALLKAATGGSSAQVLYRLSLAEGIRHGRQTNRAFSLDNARRKALLLEAEGKEDLNFSCNILVLGKTGVGKSATINSIFGEEKSRTDAFSSATTNVREIVGDVDGVKIRIIDTPGLRPNVMDQGSNRKILAAVKNYTKKCPPDIVLYVDRLDSLSRDLNDLPLLKTITAVLGSSIWFNAIVALTHAASAPPEGLNGAPMTYEVLMAQRSHIIQQSIRQAAGDMRLMNPVALVENHPSCRKNREGQKVLPNGQSWRHQMLLLCYSSKILSEANSLLKLQDPNPGKLFGFRFRSPSLPFLLSSLLQSRAHPKLSAEQGGNEGDSDVELDDYSDVEQDDDEEEYDQLPPFKPLTKAQLARLTKEQKNAYFDEYDYRVKLLQKKQWKDEIRRLKEMKKRGKTDLDDYGYANIAGENDQDPPPENVSVPLPDMVLPPSFDCDNPTYRYRFLESTSTVLARPVLDAHGWDHDCGYDGVSVEETLAILSRFPANVAVQVTKDKKEFSIHLDSSIAAKHGENASSLAGFDIQTVGRQLAYILRGEAKIKNIKKNKTTGGFSVTFLGDIVATGLKVEDQLSLGKRLSLVASTGAMRAQGETAYGANLEARLKDKDYPIGQSLSTLGLSLMKWRRDLALGANLQSQFSIGRGSKMAVRLGLNNKLSGQITVRTSTSEQVQIALLGLVPVAASIYRSFRPSEPSFAY
ncbi:Translocase of chloroplast 159 chloroplastic [Zea mays]|uniref:Translocase of chloroplast 159 chloroplastic n=1 Tax=Zea mays TaxID=4577 RepID=A0A1D6FUE4_MAIZE|nr:Translocase of chloroplast 159 chloroplastic [Zea mays]